MKKIFAIFIMILFFLTGCGKQWEDKIKVSELNFKDGYVIGEIKNITDLRYDLTIIVDLKSSSQTFNGIIFTDVIDSNQTKKVKYKYNKVKDINDEYEVIIKDVLVSSIAIYHQNSPEKVLDNFPILRDSKDSFMINLTKYEDFKDIKFNGVGTSEKECGIYPICINYDINNSKNLLFYYDDDYSLKEISLECKFGSYPDVLINENEKKALMNIMNIDKNNLVDIDENDALFNNNEDNYELIMNNDFEKYYKYPSGFSMLLEDKEKSIKITDKVYSKTHMFIIEINKNT